MDYALLDSGDGCKLERFGRYVLQRPAQQAVWPRDPRTDWKAADAVFVRGTSGYGEWHGARRPTRRWEVDCDGLRLLLEATAFGHVGLFPEFAPLWRRIERDGSHCKLLNLFGYTGALSLCAARGGAQVTHVDAVKKTVDWARDNCRASGLEDRPIRWIAEDARKWVARELRRGARYQAIALDPPTFGRGSQKEVWQIETDLAPLLDGCFRLLDPDARLLLLSCHTPGLVGPGLANLLLPLQAERGGRIEQGELVIESGAGLRVLPSGSFARWSPGKAG